MPIYISKFISVRIYRPTMVFLKPLRESIGFRAYIEIIESIDKKSKSILRMSITKNTLIFCLGIVLIPIERAFALEDFSGPLNVTVDNDIVGALNVGADNVNNSNLFRSHLMMNDCLRR